MKLISLIRDRVRALLRRDNVINEIDREMRSHINLEVDANLKSGMTEEEGRRQAVRNFGSVSRARDAAYDVRGGGLLETLTQDIRYGCRVLAKHKAFTTIAVLTLGLGIGANTAIFSVVNELLLRPLPFRDPEQVVMVWEVTPEGRRQNTASRANFRAWREQASSFEYMAAFTDQRVNLTELGEPEELTVQLATADFFKVLGVEPILGRTFMAEDSQPDKDPVVVLGYGFWQRRFGGQSDVIGKSITLNARKATVIGVMPRNFEFHIKQRSGTGRAAELWNLFPIPPAGTGAGERGRFLSSVARLKPGISANSADTEMRTIAARLSEEFPQFNKSYSAEVIPLREQFFGNVRRPLWLMLGAVGFVLLIACANVANLLLSLASSRAKEIALRSALGAGRLRIFRQLLTESLLLALMGSALGLGLAWLGMKALVAMSPKDLVGLNSVSLNFTVLLWTLAISAMTGIVFGLAPALQMSRINLNDTLKEGGKAEASQSSGNRRLRSGLVIAEIALAVILLASAGLLVRSFIHLQQVDRGFKTENVLTMVVRLPSAGREDPQMVQFFNQTLERVRNLPTVQSVGMVNYLPFYGGLGAATGFTIEGRPAPPPGQRPTTNVRVANSKYFETLEIPLLRGRSFSDVEDREKRHVLLINETMAAKYFPNEDPIGKRLDVRMFEGPNPAEVIGIVGNVRYESLIDEMEPLVYFPHSELTYPFMTLVVRVQGDPAAIAPAVQREIRSLDANQPVSDVRTMDQVMSESVSRSRFNTMLLAIFAGLATLLSAVGIFGVMNYSVALRTREIGLRLAIGAQPSQVLLLVMKQGLLLTVSGIALGLVAAFGLTRLMSSLLFGVAPVDLLTFGSISVLLILVSLLACYLPARRAMRIDPLNALRYE